MIINDFHVHNRLRDEDEKNRMNKGPAQGQNRIRG